MQAIANSAAFHFAMIEQGGSNLYTTLSLQVTSLEVLRIWSASAGGGRSLRRLAGRRCQWVEPPLAEVKDPETGTFFPNLDASGVDSTRANKIFPVPSNHRPEPARCSIVRPTLSKNGGAMERRVPHVTGLFQGQCSALFAAAQRSPRRLTGGARRLNDMPWADSGRSTRRASWGWPPRRTPRYATSRSPPAPHCRPQPVTGLRPRLTHPTIKGHHHRCSPECCSPPTSSSCWRSRSIFLGPKRLPDAGRALGQGLREFKASIGGESADQSPLPPATPDSETPVR